MKRIFAFYCGGLGDVILQRLEDPYISGINELKMLRATYATAVVVSHNLSSAEIFRHDNVFDEILTLPYTETNSKEAHIAQMMDARGFQSYSDVVIPGALMPIRCSPEDRDWALRIREEYIRDSRRIILFQGRGSNPDFNVDHMIDLDRVCDVAAQNHAVVVAVGGGYQHVSDKVNVLEEPRFTCNRENFIDLRNAANPRRVCLLSRMSLGFVGAFSAFLWPTRMAERPCVIFVPPGLRNGHVQKAMKMGVHLYPVVTEEIAKRDQHKILEAIISGLYLS